MFAMADVVCTLGHTEGNHLRHSPQGGRIAQRFRGLYRHSRECGNKLFQGLDPRLRGDDGLNETSAVSFPSAAAGQQAGLEFFQQGIAQGMQFTQTP